MAKSDGKVHKINLDKITLDPRLQCRASIDMATVDEYAEAIRTGAERDGTQPRVYADTARNAYWLADGWHWWYATGKAGKQSMDCYVVAGTFLDALKFAVGANATHGKQRTAEDKRRSIVACLEDESLNKLSTREISDLCRVSRDLTERVRGLIEGVRAETRTGKDGKQQAATKPERKVPLPPPSKSTPTHDPVSDMPPEMEMAGEVETTFEEVPEDQKGRPIPEALRPTFADRSEFGSDVQALGKLLTKWEEFSKNHKAGAFVSHQSLKIAVENLQAAISSARPYIVCPACDGTTHEAGDSHNAVCKLCRADGEPQGWLPAGKWSSLSEPLKNVAQGFRKGDAYDGDLAA